MIKNNSQSGLIKGAAKTATKATAESIHKRLTSPKKWAAAGWKKTLVTTLKNGVKEALK